MFTVVDMNGRVIENADSWRDAFEVAADHEGVVLDDDGEVVMVEDYIGADREDCQ